MYEITARVVMWCMRVLLAAMLLAQGDIRKNPEYVGVMQRIEQMRKAKKPSTSVGGLSNGRIENAAELPADGIGYKLMNPGRKTNFGTDEMVFGLMELGAILHIQLGEFAIFHVGDIGAEKGGKLSPHINHQVGRDVDLALFVAGAGSRMVTFDAEGKAKDNSRFDLERNWVFVCAMLENSFFGQDVDAIYLADWLKKLLLDAARERLAKIRSPAEADRQAKLIARAEKLIAQPKSSPHDNHMHLRIKLTAEDRQQGGKDF